MLASTREVPAEDEDGGCIDEESQSAANESLSFLEGIGVPGSEYRSYLTALGMLDEGQIRAVIKETCGADTH